MDAGLDVNGDGINDLVVGNPGVTATNSNAGQVYLFSGTALGTAASPFATLTPFSTTNSRNGTSVGLLEDVQSDGYAEVLIGSATRAASGSTYTAGAVAAQFGGTSLSGNDFQVTGATGTYTGWHVEAVGDILSTTGGVDGVPDWAFSSGTSLYIVSGGSTGSYSSLPMANSGTVTSIQIDASAPNLTRFDWDLVERFDNDVDGCTDLAIGDASGGYGDLYLYEASCPESSDRVVADFIHLDWNMNTVSGTEGARWLGNAGDFDGDGYEDVVVGGLNLNSGAGAAAIYLAPLSSSSSPTVRLDGVTTTDKLGRSVGGIGDVDNDGLDDVLIGAGKSALLPACVAGRVHRLPPL